MAKRSSPREKLEEVAFTVKLRVEERALLDECVRHRQLQDRATLGRDVRLSAGEFVRAIILEYARVHEIMLPNGQATPLLTNGEK